MVYNTLDFSLYIYLTIWSRYSSMGVLSYTSLPSFVLRGDTDIEREFLTNQKKTVSYGKSLLEAGRSLL